MLRHALLSGVALIVAVGILSACAPPERMASERLILRTYPVADLVVPLDKGGLGAAKTLENRLMAVIQDSIDPMGWSVAGGSGHIDYFPLTMSLVVRQTGQVHAEIEKLLASLRRAHDIQVAVELRFVSVSPEMMAKINQRLDDSGTPGMALLDDEAVRELLTSVQEDPQTNVMQAPKVTMYNGQRAHLDLTEQQTYLVGMEWEERDGKKVPKPLARVLKSGLQISMLATVEPKRRRVSMHLGIEVTRASAPSKSERPTQPRFSTIAVEKTLKLNEGQSALLTGWTRQREVRQEVQPPILNKVPYVNKLFRNVGYTTETEHTFVLVTPRLVVTEEQEEVEVSGDEEVSEPEVLPMPQDEAMEAVLPDILYVNRRSFDLTYEVEPVGPARLRSVEVWVTRPGENWQRYPYEVRPLGSVPITVQAEGKFGFTLVPTNTAGVRGTAPREGDAPQVCVVVDQTNPKLELAMPELVGSYPAGEVHFGWRATDDQKLAENPVSLYWGESMTGPWHLIVDKLDERGTYTAAQRDLPGVFFLRAVARDAAGNRIATQSTEPIKLDRRMPVIRGVRVKPRLTEN